MPFVIKVARAILRAVPTPESAEAFAKLVAARTRLNEITKELNEAHTQMRTSMDARKRHSDLQKEWEQAFKDFETATDEFAAAVHRAKDQRAVHY